MAGGSSSAARARINNPSLDADLSDAEWGEISVNNSRNTRPGSAATSSKARTADSDMVTEDKPWTIVLATSSGDDAQRSAAQTLQSIRTRVPDLASARVIPLHSGAIVAYGAYSDVRDDKAQKDLAWIKKVTVGAGRPFATATLTRAPVSALAKGPLKPHDLRTAREMYPDVDPLYTLQVGVWLDPDGETMRPADVRANAEKQVEELRLRGYEAYFFHDRVKVVSIVTVGLFGKSAVVMDESLKTPVYSDEVLDLLKKFPAHLVNGNELLEPNSANLPKKMGTRVQTPKLVVVPKE